MAKYVYSEDDVLTKSKEAEQYKDKKGWFSDNLDSAYKRANEDKDSFFYGRMQPSGTPSHPFYRPGHGGNFKYFCLEHEAAYEELQQEWIEENDIKKGSLLKVVSLPSEEFYSLNPALDKYPYQVGRVHPFYDSKNQFVRVERENDFNHFWGLPYTCLEKVTEPEWKVGDWFKNEDGEIHRVRAVCSNNMIIDEYADHWHGEDVTKIHFEPFDLSNPEVRKNLRGKWIICNTGTGPEFVIDTYNYQPDSNEWTARGALADSLLANYHFDDGTPVGKEVEG